MCVCMRACVCVMDSYKVDCCIRGFHLYNIIWTPVIGEELICHREPSNTMDPYAVSVIKDSITVGHLPRKISAALGGRTNSCVTESRRYSRDLSQGGLEIPCKILFRGSIQHMAELKKLAKYFGTTKKPDNSDQLANRIHC